MRIYSGRLWRRYFASLEKSQSRCFRQNLRRNCRWSACTQMMPCSIKTWSQMWTHLSHWSFVTRRAVQRPRKRKRRAITGACLHNCYWKSCVRTYLLLVRQPTNHPSNALLLLKLGDYSCFWSIVRHEQHRDTSFLFIFVIIRITRICKCDYWMSKVAGKSAEERTQLCITRGQFWQSRIIQKNRVTPAVTSRYSRRLTMLKRYSSKNWNTMR